MSKALQAKEILSKHISRQRMARQFRLPAERILANQLGYSRATIGKALGVLEGEGVILRKKGSGTFIANSNNKQTMTIALAMRTSYHYTDLHFRLIIEEISKYAEKSSIYIQIYDRLEDMFKDNPDKNSLMNAIHNGIIDGVVITSRMPLSIASRINAICPAVTINNILGDGSEVPCISCDYFRVGFLAGKYLLENGHRKVAYITEDVANPEFTFELSGFKSALEMGGVSLKDTDILDTKRYSETFTKRVIGFFNDSSYTACFVRSTCYASKMISILKKNGIRVPDDLSVIAVGNYKNSQLNKLKMTIIDNQLEEMCHVGLKLVQDIIKNKNKTKGGLKLLAPKVIENGSVINLNK